MTGNPGTAKPRVTVSVVSHGHSSWWPDLLADLADCLPGALEVILTLNVPEAPSDWVSAQSPPTRVVRNATPNGFGANHNAAFRLAQGEAFCVLNPDVRIRRDPFPALLAALGDHAFDVAAPRVCAPDGSIEETARPYPTPARLIARLVGHRTPPPSGHDVTEVDWIAGMFMLMRSDTYARLGGFDERYFLYYEDVEFCARARLGGGRILYVPEAEIIHAAHRTSHRRLSYARLHGRSMLRYFMSPTYRALRRRSWLTA